MIYDTLNKQTILSFRFRPHKFDLMVHIRLYTIYGSDIYVGLVKRKGFDQIRVLKEQVTNMLRYLAVVIKTKMRSGQSR